MEGEPNSELDRDGAARPTTALLTPSAEDFTRLGGRDLTLYERRRIQRRHEGAPIIVDRARAAGVEIGYLGVSALFNEARLYRGSGTNWVLAPVDEHEPAIVPRVQQRLLHQLERANAAPFLLYGAHEIDQAKSSELLAQLPAGRTVVSREVATELVGPVPAPAAALELADRLDGHSTKVLSALRRGAPIAGAVLLGVLAAPFLLAGAAVGALATVDPILIGAVPVLRSEVGEPALFFELVRWNWEVAA